MRITTAKELYRRLAQIYHPDMPLGNPELMQEINKHKNNFPALKALAKRLNFMPEELGHAQDTAHQPGYQTAFKAGPQTNPEAVKKFFTIFKKKIACSES